MANNNSGEIKTYGAIRCKTAEGKAAYAQQIYDEEQGQFQSEINQNINDMVAEVHQMFLYVDDDSPTPSNTSALCGSAICGYAICGTN